MPNNLPLSWDWREHIEMTPVKDQKGCNMCWAVVDIDCASIGMHICGITEDMVELSAKDLLDSAEKKYFNIESDKGYYYTLKKAFDYMKDTRVLPEDQCPFEPKKSQYKKKTPQQEKALVKIAGCEEIDSLNELELMKAVLEYPTAGCVELFDEYRDKKGLTIYLSALIFIL